MNNNPKNKHNNNNFDTIDSSNNGTSGGFTQTRIIKPLVNIAKSKSSGGNSSNINRQTVPMSQQVEHAQRMEEFNSS